MENRNEKKNERQEKQEIKCRQIGSLFATQELTYTDMYMLYIVKCKAKI